MDRHSIRSESAKRSPSDACLKSYEMSTGLANEIHVRVSILSEKSLATCEFCTFVKRRLNKAAYSLHDVNVCRNHVAKILDAATKMQADAQHISPFRVVTSMLASRMRNRTDPLHRLKVIGILDITDHD
jgi:glutaredoxin